MGGRAGTAPRCPVVAGKAALNRPHTVAAAAPAQLTGIAAILRFPLPDIADEDPDGDGDAETDGNADDAQGALGMEPVANALAMIPPSGRQSPELGD